MLIVNCQKTKRVLKYRWGERLGHVNSELSEDKTCIEVYKTDCLDHVTTCIPEKTVRLYRQQSLG